MPRTGYWDIAGFFKGGNGPEAEELRAARTPVDIETLSATNPLVRVHFRLVCFER